MNDKGIIISFFILLVCYAVSLYFIVNPRSNFDAPYMILMTTVTPHAVRACRADPMCQEIMTFKDAEEDITGIWADIQEGKQQ